MKHYNVSTKKFIKNVVCLAVSALLLAAATYAWFMQSSPIVIPSFSGETEAPRNIQYAHMQADTSYLDFDALTRPTLTVRVRTESNGTITTDDFTPLDYMMGQNSSGTRTWLDGQSDSTWNLTSTIPGVYGAYRVSFSGDSTGKTLRFSTITYGNSITASVKENALKSLYVYAAAKKTVATTENGVTTTSTTDIGTPVSSSLYDLLYSNGSYLSSADVLTLPGAANSLVDVYYIIGMPANADISMHDIVREVGAAISIQAIDVVDAS